MIRFIAAFFVLTACGPSVRERFIQPEPKHLEEGASANFVLDTGASSELLKSGTLVITVSDIGQDETIITGVANVQTILGPKNQTMTNALENEVLTLDFLENLRTEKRHQAKNALITYAGLTKSACDMVSLSNIKGSQGITLTPTICVSSSTIPEVSVKFDASGTSINAVFKASK